MTLHKHLCVALAETILCNVSGYFFTIHWESSSRGLTLATFGTANIQLTGAVAE